MIDWGKNLGTMLISGEFHVKKSQLVLLAPCQLWVSVESFREGGRILRWGGGQKKFPEGGFFL